MNTTPDLTPATLTLFDSLYNDKENWSGTPLFDGSKEERGNLTHLKKAGLLTTATDEGHTFVYFTPAGEEFGATRRFGPIEEAITVAVTAGRARSPKAKVMTVTEPKAPTGRHILTREQRAEGGRKAMATRNALSRVGMRAQKAREQWPDWLKEAAAQHRQPRHGGAERTAASDSLRTPE